MIYLRLVKHNSWSNPLRSMKKSSNLGGNVTNWTLVSEEPSIIRHRQGTGEVDVEMCGRVLHKAWRMLHVRVRVTDDITHIVDYYAFGWDDAHLLGDHTPKMMDWKAGRGYEVHVSIAQVSMNISQLGFWSVLS